MENQSSPDKPEQDKCLCFMQGPPDTNGECSLKKLNINCDLKRYGCSNDSTVNNSLSMERHSNLFGVAKELKKLIIS